MRALILSLLALTSWCGAEDPLDLSTELEAVIRDKEVPGIAAAAIWKGDLTATGAAGIRKMGSTEKITLKDKFHIGSCTKSMTASLAAMLVADGKITWETKAADVFKDFTVDPGFKDVTLRQLLSNTGGAPHDTPKGLWTFVGAGPETEQRRRFSRFILSEKPAYPPGQGNIYSNSGFTIGGAMLEQVTGKPYAELMEKRLFKPLGITTAGMGAAATLGKTDQPYGHRRAGDKLVAVDPNPGDNPPAISPAGRVHLSITDFAKYAGLHLGDLKNGPLDAAQLADLHRVVTPAKDYACGWTVTSRGWAGGTVLTHNGTNTMNFAVMWLAPEIDFAVVVACNSGEGAKACDEAAALFIKRIIEDRRK